MIDTAADKLLWIEPEFTNSVTAPVIDSLTRKMAAAFRAAVAFDHTRGAHICTGCDSGHSSCSYRLTGGLETHALCVHYLAYHRAEVPADQLTLIDALTDGEVEPNSVELSGGRSMFQGGDLFSLHPLR